MLKKIKMGFVGIGLGIVGLILYSMRRQIFKAIYNFRLTPSLPLVLFFVFVVIVGVLVYIFIILRSAKNKEVEAEAVKAPEPTPKKTEIEPSVTPSYKSSFSSMQLSRSFAKAEKILRNNVSGRNYRYQIPWFVMIGENGAGKTSTLDTSGLNLPFGKPVSKGPEVKDVLNWWFFEKGIVLDVAGDLVLQEDGQSSDIKLWRKLLHLLQTYRPHRPIDGVILAVPCTDLLSDRNQHAIDLNKIGQKADMLNRKLWDAQRILGIRFPIYLLVTKCDQVTGFRSFHRQLPERMTNHIFGWSCPFTIDTAYSEEWGREAFKSLNKQLFQTQFEIFTKGALPGEADGLFQFPAKFSQLEAPLQIYLDHLFRQTVYHESFVLRGIYFCGDRDLDSDHPDEINPCFVKDLFEKKIFQEFLLARPLKKTLVSRNRKVRLAQAVCLILLLVLGIGEFRAFQQLQIDKRALLPVLQQIYEDVGQLRKKEAQLDSLRRYEFLRERNQNTPFDVSARNLIKGMTNVRGLKYVFIPASYIPRPWKIGDDIHTKIRKAISIAYEEIILKSMEFGLNLKIKDIFDKIPQAEPDKNQSYEIVAIDKMQEFRDLKQFVDDIRELEQYVKMYNNLRESEDLKDLGRIVTYLFHFELSQEFFNNAQYYHHALQESKYQAFDPFRFEWKARTFSLRKLTDRLYYRLFDTNIADAYLQILALQLENFGKQKRTSGRDESLIKDLIATIENTESILARPKLSWVFNKEFDLGKDFDVVLEQVQESDYLGPELESEMKEEGGKEFKQLKRRLKSRSSRITGTLIRQQNGEIIADLSPGVVNLRQDLEKLLDQDFMTFEPVSQHEFDIPPGMRLRWDSLKLEEAVKLFEPYELFKKEKLEKFHPDMQGIITRMAKENLEKRVMDLVSQAQRFEPIPTGINNQLQEADVLAEIRNFSTATNQLNQLLIYCDQLNLVTSHLFFSDILHWQSSSLLEAVDGFLKDDSLYAIKGGNFSWWDGKEKLSLAAFEVVDDKELENYLALQSKRIKFLADEYAKPLSTFFDATQMIRNSREEQLIFKWDRIIKELEKYDNKKPENSVTILENFIQFEINKVNETNYAELISPEQLQERSGDIFLHRRNELRRMLYHRCERLAAENVIKKYNIVRTFFDNNLAGRYPFADVAGKTEFPEANPELIKDFFTIFDENAAAIKASLKDNAAFAQSGRKTMEFIDKIQDVRKFFTAYYEGEEGQPKPEKPEFDIELEFRVNRSHEQNANQIIEWNATIGDVTIDKYDTEHTGRWRFGDPVKVSLRWAKNGLQYPVSIGESTTLEIQDRTATFKYQNQWSLVRLLEEHLGSPNDFDKHEDPKPHTLKFEINCRRVGDEGQSNIEYYPAKVFVRFLVKTPDKVKRVLQLPDFPNMAPNLERQTFESSQ